MKLAYAVVVGMVGLALAGCSRAKTSASIAGEPDAGTVAEDRRQSDAPAPPPGAPGDDIVALFDAYGQAMTEHDLTRTIHYYAPSFLYGDHTHSSIMPGGEARRAAVEQENAYYRDVLGMTSAKVRVTSQVSLKDHHVFVRTVWGCTFKKTGDRVVDFPIDFIIDRTSGSPKIVAHILEEDEPKIFRDLGLVE